MPQGVKVKIQGFYRFSWKLVYETFTGGISRVKVNMENSQVESFAVTFLNGGNILCIKCRFAVYVQVCAVLFYMNRGYRVIVKKCVACRNIKQVAEIRNITELTFTRGKYHINTGINK